MDILILFLDAMGSIVCHQLPERTLSVGGKLLPLCARDTGIYLGLFTALIYIAIKKRSNSDNFPSIAHTLMLCGLMLPMIVDALTSYMGLRYTSNEIRLFTGMFFGMPIPFFLIPAANFKIYEENRRCILKSWVEIISIFTVACIVCLLVLKTSVIPWTLLSSILIFSMVFVVGRTVYTVIKRVGIEGRKHTVLITIGITSVILFLMFLVSHFMLEPIKDALLQLK